MNVVLVTYNLIAPGAESDYEGLISAIGRCCDAVEVQRSVRRIRSYGRPNTIRNDVGQDLFDPDRLLIEKLP